MITKYKQNEQLFHLTVCKVVDCVVVVEESGIVEVTIWLSGISIDSRYTYIVKVQPVNFCYFMCFQIVWVV